MKILINISASIATYKVCEVVSLLKKEKHEVQVVMTKNAQHFVGKASFEGLSGEMVHDEVFQNGEMMGHIELARWADVICLAPASANQINKLFGGLSDDLIGSIFLANNFQKPYLIFPAMNSQMLAHPATQNSLDVLAKWGAHIFQGPSGELACGEYGVGRLLEPPIIVEKINTFNRVLR